MLAPLFSNRNRHRPRHPSHRQRHPKISTYPSSVADEAGCPPAISRAAAAASCPVHPATRPSAATARRAPLAPVLTGPALKELNATPWGAQGRSTRYELSQLAQRRVPVSTCWLTNSVCITRLHHAAGLPGAAAPPTNSRCADTLRHMLPGALSRARPAVNGAAAASGSGGGGAAAAATAARGLGDDASDDEGDPAGRRAAASLASSPSPERGRYSMPTTAPTSVAASAPANRGDRVGGMASRAAAASASVRVPRARRGREARMECGGRCVPPAPVDEAQPLVLCVRGLTTQIFVCGSGGAAI